MNIQRSRVGPLLGEAGSHLAAERGDRLLELRVEPGEVELIELAQVRPVRGVHGVEPPSRPAAADSG